MYTGERSDNIYMYILYYTAEFKCFNLKGFIITGVAQQKLVKETRAI